MKLSWRILAVVAAFILLGATTSEASDNAELSARDLLAKTVEAVRWANQAHIKSDIETRPWDKGWAIRQYHVSTEIYSSGNQLHSVWYVLGNDGQVAIRWDLLLTP